MLEVNVIIPCYNHSLYIENCLESVISSYSGKINIICCDDNSSDNSYNLASIKLAELEFKTAGRMSYELFKNKENLGVCSTLNNCISMVNSEYIYLIASDDYLLPRTLDEAMEILIKNEYDLLISDCHVVDECNNLLFESAIFGFRNGYKKAYEINKSHNLVNELVMNWVIPGPSTLLRSSVYSSIGLYDETLRAEDRDFYLRALSKCNVGYSKSPIACYRVHHSNISRSHEYMDNIRVEMAGVSLMHASKFKGLSFLYLLSFWFEKSPFSSLFGKVIRKFIYNIFKMTIK